jgi:hypothetical protein
LGAKLKLKTTAAILAIIALTLSGCSATESAPKVEVPAVLAGDACTEASQMIVPIEGGALECRLFAGNERKYVQVSTNPTPPTQTLNISPIKTCQLKDNISVPGIWTGGSVGYPAAGEFASVGEINVAVVPIDFSDNPATDDASWLQEQIDIFDDWVNRFSNGNATLNWQFENSWIRAPKEAKFYNWGHKSFQADGTTALDGTTNETNLQTQSEMANQLFTAAESKYNFKNVDYVFFVFPKDIGMKIDHGPDLRAFDVRTPKGKYKLGFSFTSGQFYRSGVPWHQWLHEFMHSAGLKGHAPGNEYMYNIMAWDSGPGKALTAWDSFILGWLNEGQVACYDIKNLKEETVVLASMDSALPGVRTAIIRLSNHEAVVIETRRKDKYSAGLPDAFYGVQAYYVDTNKGEGRYDWALDRETEMKYFAYYLWVDAEDHGVGQPDVMTYDGPMEPGNLNMNGYVGDTFTYKNLKIEITETGDFDTVILSKM